MIPSVSSNTAIWPQKTNGDVVRIRRSSTVGSPADYGGEKVLTLLASDDWSAISAAVGHPVGPDPEGNLPQLAPISAYMVANMRRDGDLAPGARLTLDVWVSKFGDGHQLDPADPRNSQSLDLIAYLKAQSATSIDVRA